MLKKGTGSARTQLTENRKNRSAKLFRILTCEMCMSDTHGLSTQMPGVSLRGVPGQRAGGGLGFGKQPEIVQVRSVLCYCATSEWGMLLMSIETESGKGRILAVDVARFYAMALVFYGHFIERFMLLKNPAGFVQYKFIYSFHMVVFFVLAGYVVRETDITFPFGKYFKTPFYFPSAPLSVFYRRIYGAAPLLSRGIR